VQEEIPKIVVHYNVQEDETERDEVRVEREQDFFEVHME
jgi:hypothetical protein